MRNRRIASLAVVAMASAVVFSAQAGTASAADSYYCSAPYSEYPNISLAGCIHLGGNGYWQPYVQVVNNSGSAVWVGNSGDQTHIFSGGVEGGFGPLQGGWVSPGTHNVWGHSTNWRNTCYIRGESDAFYHNGTLTYVSPTEYVC